MDWMRCTDAVQSSNATHVKTADERRRLFRAERDSKLIGFDGDVFDCRLS